MMDCLEHVALAQSLGGKEIEMAIQSVVSKDVVLFLQNRRTPHT